MMTPVERLLERQPDAKKAGKGWSATNSLCRPHGPTSGRSPREGFTPFGRGH